MSLDDVAAELHQVAPGGFVAARDARAGEARACGDRELAGEIKKLRRPTVSAWLVNRLASESSQSWRQFVELGPSLRSAQAELAGDQMRALSRQRRDVIAALELEAKDLAREAGVPASDSALAEVRATLEAALADPSAAAAVATRRLTTSLDYSGLGGVDLSDAVAAGPAASAAASKGATSKAGKKKADGPPASQNPTEVRAAETAASAARQEAARAHAVLDRAARELDRIRVKVTQLEEQLVSVRGDLDQADARHRRAVAEAESADRKERETSAALRRLKPQQSQRRR